MRRYIEQAECQLIDIHLPKSKWDQVKFIVQEAEPIQRHYSHRRQVEQLTFTYQFNKWHLTAKNTVEIGIGAGRRYLLLTPYQDSLVMELMRAKYEISRR